MLRWCNVATVVLTRRFKLSRFFYNNQAYRLEFVVSISSLHSILNACQNLINTSVAYTFPNICEKTQQFLSSIKRDAHERKLAPFFCLTVFIDVSTEPMRIIG